MSYLSLKYFLHDIHLWKTERIIAYCVPRSNTVVLNWHCCPI